VPDMIGARVAVSVAEDVGTGVRLLDEGAVRARARPDSGVSEGAGAKGVQPIRGKHARSSLDSFIAPPLIIQSSVLARLTASS
jgi:hypothetical protein